MSSSRIHRASIMVGALALGGLGLLFLVYANNDRQSIREESQSSLRNNHRGLIVVEDFLDPRSVFPREKRHLTFQFLLDQYVPAEERSEYLIDIGGNIRDYDHKATTDQDPIKSLLPSGYEGILLKDLKEATDLHINPERVAVIWGNLKHDTILQMLSLYGAKKDADAVKVNIDTFDSHPLLETVLEGGYLPKVIVVASAESIDTLPPVWLDILREKFGYKFVGMNEKACSTCEHNVWFVSKEFSGRDGSVAAMTD